MNKLTKKEIKLHQKPWVSRQIRKTMLRRDKTYKKFLKAKTTEKKNEICKTYKEIRNKIVSLCHISKKKLQNIQIMQKKLGKG